MKTTLITLLATVLCVLQASAQVFTSITTESTTCYGSQDGSIHVNLEACYAPLQVTSDSDTVIVNGLNNDEYYGLVHGGAPNTQEAFDVWGGATAVGGMFVVTGYFVDSIAFDSVTLYSSGQRDIFVAAYDTSNNLLWAKAAGGTDYDEGKGVTAYNNRIYVAGYFGGQATFDTTALNASGLYDGFIAKYDLSGNLLAVTNVGGNNIAELRKLFIHDTAIYAIGDHTGNVTVNLSTVTSAGGYDPLVVCYDTNLNGTWALNGGSSSDEFGYDITGDTAGGTLNQLYVTGDFTGAATFGGTNLNTLGGQDAFIARVSPGGSWGWALGGGSAGLDAARSIRMSSAFDSLYVVGYYENAMTMGVSSVTSNGVSDAYVLRMDTAGNTGLLTTIGGASYDYAYDLEALGNGYLVVSGQMSDTVFLNNDTLVSQGGLDAYTIKLTAGHSDVWSKRFGGPAEDSYTAVNRGAGDRLHNAGFFRGTAFGVFDTLTSLGNKDVVATNDDIFGTAANLQFNNLAAGNYTVLTLDNVGNFVLDTVNVPSADSISIAGAVTPASSGVAMDGAIDITVSGGTPGYTYLWSNAMTTEDLSNIGVGTYTVTVTDTNGCMDSASFVIDTNAIPLSIDTTIVGHVDCFGDSTGFIDLTVSGGAPPVTYNWSTSDTTQDLSNLAAGTYTVTVSDNDTSHVLTFTLLQNPQLTIAGTVTPPTSGASNDGAIDLTVGGGVPPYTFTWSNAATTEDLSNIGVGSYTVTVTDSLGCTGVETFAVDTLPALVLFTLASDVTCENSNNGSIDLTVQGGVAPYSFAWSNGATTEDISFLAAGVYTVTVTDDEGQTAVASDTVGSNPTEPDPVVGPFTGPASVQSWVSYNYSVAPTNGSSFSWTALGGAVLTASGNAATVQWNAGPDGTIIVEETNQVGCSATDSFEVTILFVGIEKTTENAILVYPNPARERLNVQLPEQHGPATLSITDLNGRTVLQPRTVSGSDQLDVHSLPSGVYVLHIGYPSLRLTHEIVIR